jgi:hypothetical protein
MHDFTRRFRGNKLCSASPFPDPAGDVADPVPSSPVGKSVKL